MTADRVLHLRCLNIVCRLSDMSKLDKILDRKQASTLTLGFVNRPDGSGITNSTQETLQVMLGEHFPDSEPIEDLDVRSSFEGPAREIDPLDWINNYKIRKALGQFKPHKAAGPAAGQLYQAHKAAGAAAVRGVGGFRGWGNF